MAASRFFCRSGLTLVFIYLLLQFQFAYLVNFPITISLLGLPVFILSFVRFNLTSKTVLICSAFTVVTVFNQLFSGSSENPIQFLRTYLLVLLSIFTVGIVISGKLQSHTGVRLQSMLTGLTILCGISVSQALLGYKFGSFVTDPLGKFSYEYQYRADLNSSLTRSSGLYSEPSFNALICLSFLPLVLSIRDPKKKKIYVAILAIYMISTFSLTGIVSLGSILMLSIWDDRKIRIFPLMSLLILFSLTSSYIVQRISTIYLNGSSANFRIIAPLRAILELLPRYLLGIPLGSLENNMAQFSFMNGNKVGTSVDNGWLLIVLYFGLIGMAVIGFCIFRAVSVAKKMYKINAGGWQMAVVPLFSLNFNGGIFLPDFLCIMAFMIVTIRFYIQQIDEEQMGFRSV